MQRLFIELTYHTLSETCYIIIGARKMLPHHSRITLIFTKGMVTGLICCVFRIRQFLIAYWEQIGEFPWL